MFEYLALVLIVYFHLAMEWLFFITKPSFLSGLEKSDQIAVFFAATLPVVGVVSALVFLCFVLSKILRGKVGATLLSLMPAAALSAVLFVLLNNFTYTMFEVNAYSYKGWQRALFGLPLIALFLYSIRILRSLAREQWINRARGLLQGLVSLLLIVSLACCILRYQSTAESFALKDLGKPTSSLPNIFLISSDALDAEHMSVYGYERETTPFLSELKPKMLFAENAFSNVNASAGSIVSMLASKLPTETHVLSHVEIARGRHSYEHLPGLLRPLGYQQIEFSERKFADVFDLNLRNAVHFGNFRSFDTPLHRFLANYPRIYNSEEFYFVLEVWERLSDLTLHSLGLKTARNFFQEIRAGGGYGLRDRAALNGLKEFITETQQPIFAHLHLLGTHGPFYNPRKLHFARKKAHTPPMPRDIDYYDDAVRDFDQHLSELFQFLEERGKLSNSIIVIHSDHSRDFLLGKRIPLMFYFGGDLLGQNISHNVSLLDVAPTILEYLGLDTPGWMIGSNLLNDERDKLHAIYAGANRYPKEVYFSAEPPFFNYDKVGLMICSRCYLLRLHTNELIVEDIPGHTAPCTEEELPDKAQARALILEHLRQNGFDTTTLQGS